MIDVDPQLYPASERLLLQAGLPGPFTLEQLRGGANNRVFKVKVAGQAVLLKAYFHDPRDPRDRLGAEFAFSSVAWESGLRALPRPLAQDPGNHLGLYEFVSGRRLETDEVGRAAIAQALEFYRQINLARQRPGADALPRASEACFSIAEHLACVGRRLHDLALIGAASAIDREAARFAREELLRAWPAIMAAVARRAQELKLDLPAALDPECRRLSPSDFGFHNAILGDAGRLFFIDFEYAGWDDPAKMVCDFLCQPRCPVPSNHYQWFMSEALADLAQPDRELERARMLLPVYRIKWACIVLNDFVPVAGARRRFAHAADTIHAADAAEALERHKAAQLTRARTLLAPLTGAAALNDGNLSS